MIKKDALAIALHFLKFRPRSVFEVEKKLKSKKFAEKEIDRVTSVLKKEKLLDDEKFAKMWVESRNNLRPSGSYVLKMELRRLGIADDIIEKVLTPQRDEVLAKKALDMKARYREADFEKKAAFLQRRGFSTSVIYKILKD
jgi:regulatory protein